MKTELRTYTGGCRCGQVRYSVELDLHTHSVPCISSKKKYCGALVKPAAFKLLSGEAELCDYTFNSRSVHHLFCKHCGIRSFCRGDIPEIGGAYVTVNLKCLDAIKHVHGGS